MKKLIYVLVILFIAGFTAQAKPVNPPAGFGIFFSTLNPHGVWMEMDDGLVVWRPTVIRTGWAPYREGRWIWTDDGWYWDSYEPFGQVTYHYGRWYYDNYYGWIWVPDYEWAPAWVEWRYDDMYIGWAPLPPYAVFSINTGIHYTHDYYTPYNHWHFVTYPYFDDPYVYRHFVGHNNKHKIYSRTKYRTNYGYYDGRVVNRGVDIDYVRNRSGHEIRTRNIERVRDYSQVENYRERGDKEGKVRTLYVPKEELRKERDLNNDVIKRSERKSSLDVSRVEIGERRTTRNEDRNRETVIREERKNTGTRDTEIRNPGRDVQKERTGNRNEGTTVRERSNDNRTGTVREKQDVRENKVDVRNNENSNRNRRENTVNNERKQRRETPVVTGRNNQNERVDRTRTEVRTQNNTTERREVRRTETSNQRKNESRVERNNSGDDNKRTKNRNR